MDPILEQMMGMDANRTAIYRYADGQVSKEDFEYARVIDQVLFDEKIGYIATLGPTWNMVHDPRFVKLENTFVIERKARFGGNATVGVSIITEDGMGGGNNDLERYSDILGEGRNMLKAVRTAGLDPQKFQNNPDAIWLMIRQESPNWFRQNNTANKEATRLFDMCSIGLVGLIDDYAEVPLANEWVDGESGELLTPATTNDPDVLGVNLEVDQLDKALSARTQLRLLAMRVLNELGLVRKLKGEEGRLTDFERDDLLRIIYQSEWPEGKPKLMMDLLAFIANATNRPFEERQREQLMRASEKSKEMVAQLKAGTLQQINRETDGIAPEFAKEDTTRMLDDIMHDPLKRHLFPIYTQAEKAKQTELVELLAPIFATPDYVLSDDHFWEVMTKVKKLTAPLPVQKKDEQFHSKESPYRS
jgi:hypothetical protein